MKRLRSSDDLDSYEKNASKEQSQYQNRSSRSSSSSGFYYKPSSVVDSNVRNKGRYDRDQSVADEDSGRERMVRKRGDHDFDSFDRRKLEFDRYRDSGSSIRRSESFRVPCRDFPKGFRSERDRSRRESSSSWQRFGVNENKGSTSSTKLQPREVRDVKSPNYSRDSSVTGRVVGESREREEMRKSYMSRSPTRSKDSGSEQSKSGGGGGQVKKSEATPVESETSSEMEEGELDPEPQTQPEDELATGSGIKRDEKQSCHKETENDGGEMNSNPEVAEEVNNKTANERKDEPKVDDELQDYGKSLNEGPSGNRDKMDDVDGDEVQMQEEGAKVESKCVVENSNDAIVHNSSCLDESCKEDKGIGLEMQVGACEAVVFIKEVTEENGEHKTNMSCKEDKGIGLDMQVGACEAVEFIKEVTEENGEHKTNMSCKEDKGIGLEMQVGACEAVEFIKEVTEENGEHKTNMSCKEDKGIGLEMQVGACEAVEFIKEVTEENGEHKTNMSCKEDKGIGLEMQVGACEVVEFIKEVTEENGEHKTNINVVEIGLTCNVKDKGKGIAVELTNVTDSAENGVWTERESKDKKLHIEAPSTRGFELFSCSPVRRVEKKEQSGADKKEGKLEFESLDLSLSLPNVLLPIGAQHTDAVPGSPSHVRRVQSLSNTFHTNSDGFTASMSFSGSLSFYHNPSCSLTQNSMDNNEQSVHSRPIFQGVDQILQGSCQSQNDSRQKDVSMFQKILRNGSGSFSQSSALQGITNGQATQAQNIHGFEGSSKVSNGLERQLSFNKQNDVRFTSQSVMSHQNGSFYDYEKKQAMRDKHNGSLYRRSIQKEQEQLLIGGADFVETILSRMVFEPIHVMARKFHEMTGQSIACLKESIHEIMLNADKNGELRASQETLRSRSELTLEMLLKCHRAQLEILVALKTDLPEYLQVDSSVSSSDLAEVFLTIRCINLTCRTSIPVDECDCKVCSKKIGFCSACMCLVCSKFDMASNTCSWVGCDVCLHWCHADCGLRESYIKNGHGSAEMQFHCVACDHPSEMFGFVKEVFLNFAKEWTLETFSKELEYVKKIFSGSKDVRGKQLHELADQMFVKLAKRSDLPEVYSQIMSFLTDGRSSKPVNVAVLSGKEQGKGINRIAGPSLNPTRLKSVYSDKAPQLERSSSLLSSFRVDRPDKWPSESELQRSAQKRLFLPELESFIRIKQEEAKMYQTRADDARRDAEGLKRIAIAKGEKIEEEYSSRIAKLRLVEAEETHKQKFEEFQALERAYRECYGMKTRMEADIKDLLLKMEGIRRNLGM